MRRLLLILLFLSPCFSSQPVWAEAPAAADSQPSGSGGGWKDEKSRRIHVKELRRREKLRRLEQLRKAEREKGRMEPPYRKLAPARKPDPPKTP